MLRDHSRSLLLSSCYTLYLNYVQNYSFILHHICVSYNILILYDTHAYVTSHKTACMVISVASVDAVFINTRTAYNGLD